MRVQVKDVAVDNSGDTVGSAQIEVRRITGGGLAVLYAAATGGTTKTNPFDAEADGEYTFFIDLATEDGALEVTVGESPTDYSYRVYLKEPNEHRSFADFSTLTTWYATHADTLPLGAIMQAGGLDYERDGASTDITGLSGSAVRYPATSGANGTHTGRILGDVLTADRDVSLPDAAGTLALFSQISGVVSSSIASLPRNETGTFTPALKFATPGDTTFTYANQDGYYMKVGSLVIFSVYIRATRVPGGAPASTSEPLLLDMSDIGDTGSGPFVPADRTNLAFVMFKGGAMNQNNVRLTTAASSQDWSFYYDGTVTSGTQALTYNDLDNTASSIVWVVGFFKV